MVRLGGLWNKGPAPRSTRHFGRQFFDARDVPEPPEATGMLRGRLSYKYPRPWKSRETIVWRHADYVIPPKYDKTQHPGYNLTFTRLCYNRNHVDRNQAAMMQAHPHLSSGRKSGK